MTWFNKYDLHHINNMELHQIYHHIASMCGNPDPKEGCRLIAEFCRNEMAKLEGLEASNEKKISNT